MGRHSGTIASVFVSLVAVGLFVVAGGVGASAQQAPAAPPPGSARAVAPIDLTGVWVSIVSEDWRWRMLTAPKGDFEALPLNNQGRQVGMQWDPERDKREGNECRAYGAIGIMRMPARYRISWQDPTTLKIEIDAGQQTRLLRFVNATGESGPADWQGVSFARWQQPGGGDVGGGRGGGARGGSLLVETSKMKPGYLRKNGAPYSADALLTERFFTHRTPDGGQWLTVAQYVRDPMYLNNEYVANWHYRKEADDSKWRPTPCMAG